MCVASRFVFSRSVECCVFGFVTHLLVQRNFPVPRCGCRTCVVKCSDAPCPLRACRKCLSVQWSPAWLCAVFPRAQCTSFAGDNHLDLSAWPLDTPSATFSNTCTCRRASSCVPAARNLCSCRQLLQPAQLLNLKMAHPLQSGAAPEAWQCEEGTKMRDYSDKCHSVYDSGCISGANLSSDLSLSEDLSTRSSRPCSFTDIPAESVVSDSKSYNREDSGLDLAEPFSGLSLEYNDLGKQPSQCQTTNLPKCNVPTVESTTVLPQDNSLSLQALEFYQQNEEGDT